MAIDATDLMDKKESNQKESNLHEGGETDNDLESSREFSGEEDSKSGSDFEEDEDFCSDDDWDLHMD